MLGFLIGTICLIALIVVLRRGRWRRHGYYGHRGWGPRAWLWSLSRRLGATPQQEKLFRDELVGFIDEARGLGEAMKIARAELAGVLREERLDPSRVDALLAKQEQLISGLRGKVVAAVGNIHATLDAEQRKKIAEMVEQGPRAYAGGC